MWYEVGRVQRFKAEAELFPKQLSKQDALPPDTYNDLVGADHSRRAQSMRWHIELASFVMIYPIGANERTSRRLDIALKKGGDDCCITF